VIHGIKITVMREEDAPHTQSGSGLRKEAKKQKAPKGKYIPLGAL